MKLSEIGTAAIAARDARAALAIGEADCDNGKLGSGGLAALQAAADAADADVAAAITEYDVNPEAEA